MQPFWQRKQKMQRPNLKSYGRRRTGSQWIPGEEGERTEKVSVQGMAGINQASGRG
jgi:hypothetical protein